MDRRYGSKLDRRKQTITINDDPYVYEMTVPEYIRGDHANQIVKQANEFNSEPDQGKEYLLIKVIFKCVKHGSSSMSISDYDFKSYVNGVAYSPESTVLPSNMNDFESVSLMPGAATEGWISYIIPTGKEAKIGYISLLSTDPSSYIKISSG